MPLRTQTSSQPQSITGSSEHQQRQVIEQLQRSQPRLVYATRSNNPNQSDTELVFVVTDTDQIERTITIKNVDAASLFMQSEEGAQWLQREYERAKEQSNVRALRSA